MSVETMDCMCPGRVSVTACTSCVALVVAEKISGRGTIGRERCGHVAAVCRLARHTAARLTAAAVEEIRVYLGVRSRWVAKHGGGASPTCPDGAEHVAAEYVPDRDGNRTRCLRCQAVLRLEIGGRP